MRAASFAMKITDKGPSAVMVAVENAYGGFAVDYCVLACSDSAPRRDSSAAEVLLFTGC